MLLNVFFLLLFLNNPSFSQNKKGKEDKSPIPPKTKFDTTIQIKANVLVLDEQGKVVTDIKAEDLKVFEDGIEQKITCFAKKENMVNLGLLIDNTGSLQSQINIVNRVSSAFISNMQEKDEAFFIRFVSSDRLEILQDWTSDKTLLNEALEGTYTKPAVRPLLTRFIFQPKKLYNGKKRIKPNIRPLFCSPTAKKRTVTIKKKTCSGYLLVRTYNCFQ